MIKSSITINLATQVKTGPWVYREPVAVSLSKAAALGFDGVELFTASANSVDAALLERLLQQSGLQLSAVGTGAGKLIHGLTLTDPDLKIRKQSISFIKDMISFGSCFGAPAIIGSMQGNALPGTDRALSLDRLAEGLDILGEFAEMQGVKLIFEPLNRYETNLVNQLEDGAKLIGLLHTRNMALLADLFHMNIEEASIPESLQNFGKFVGYVHFSDSNRHPAGCGHTPMQEIAGALKEIKYEGYISAEAFPYPDPDSAAKTTIDNFNKYFKQDEI